MAERMAAALKRAMGEAGATPAAPAPVPALVLGPPRSGRSALLMRAALASAGPRTRVLFLAPCALQQLPGVPAGAGAAHALQVPGRGLTRARSGWREDPSGGRTLAGEHVVIDWSTQRGRDKALAGEGVVIGGRMEKQQSKL